MYSIGEETFLGLMLLERFTKLPYLLVTSGELEDEMYVEIDMINQTLPDTPLEMERLQAIQQWIVTVIAPEWNITNLNTTSSY